MRGGCISASPVAIKSQLPGWDGGGSSTKDAMHAWAGAQRSRQKRQSQDVCLLGRRLAGSTREEEAWAILKLMLDFIWPPFHLITPEAEVILVTSRRQGGFQAVASFWEEKGLGLILVAAEATVG